MYSYCFRLRWYHLFSHQQSAHEKSTRSMLLYIKSIFEIFTNLVGKINISFLLIFIYLIPRRINIFICFSHLYFNLLIYDLYLFLFLSTHFIYFLTEVLIFFLTNIGMGSTDNSFFVFIAITFFLLHLPFCYRILLIYRIL